MFFCKADLIFLVRSYSTCYLYINLKASLLFTTPQPDTNRISLMLPNSVNSANIHRKSFYILNYVTKVILIVFFSSLAPYFDLFHFIYMHQDLYHYKEILAVTSPTRQIAH